MLVVMNDALLQALRLKTPPSYEFSVLRSCTGRCKPPTQILEVGTEVIGWCKNRRMMNSRFVALGVKPKPTPLMPLLGKENFNLHDDGMYCSPRWDRQPLSIPHYPAPTKK